MKTIMLQILTLLLFTSTVLHAQDIITIEHSCSFDEEETDREFYSFSASSEAEQIVGQIVDAVGITKNFVVKSSDCKNALAAVEKGKRFILYNTTFLEKFKKDARTKWAAYCVLAHEIGHHLNGHDFKSDNPKIRKRMELEADIFAGSVLQKMGATLEEAKAGIELLKEKGESNTHPPARAREEAIANGWKKSEENARKSNPERPPAPSPKPKEPEVDLNQKVDPVIPNPDPNPPVKPLSEVSDLLTFNKLIGTWKLDLGYNANGQYVIVKNALFGDGSMSITTFLNNTISSTEFAAWGISNNVFVLLDQAGNFYYYTPVLSGDDIVTMTLTGSTGYSAFAVGTQFYYTRVRQ